VDAGAWSSERLRMAHRSYRTGYHFCFVAFLIYCFAGVTCVFCDNLLVDAFPGPMTLGTWIPIFEESVKTGIYFSCCIKLTLLLAAAVVCWRLPSLLNTTSPLPWRAVGVLGGFSGGMVENLLGYSCNPFNLV